MFRCLWESNKSSWKLWKILEFVEKKRFFYLLIKVEAIFYTCRSFEQKKKLENVSSCLLQEALLHCFPCQLLECWASFPPTKTASLWFHRRTCARPHRVSYRRAILLLFIYFFVLWLVFLYRIFWCELKKSIRIPSYISPLAYL